MDEAFVSRRSEALGRPDAGLKLIDPAAGLRRLIDPSFVKRRSNRSSERHERIRRPHSRYSGLLPGSFLGFLHRRWIMVSETGMDSGLPAAPSRGHRQGRIRLYLRATRARPLCRHDSFGCDRPACCGSPWAFSWPPGGRFPWASSPGGVSGCQNCFSAPRSMPLRAVPGISWLPLALVWFGIGMKTTVFLVALAAFFPIYLNAAAGARQVNPLLYQAGAMMGVGQDPGNVRHPDPGRHAPHHHRPAAGAGHFLGLPGTRGTDRGPQRPGSRHHGRPHARDASISSSSASSSSPCLGQSSDLIS